MVVRWYSGGTYNGTDGGMCGVYVWWYGGTAVAHIMVRRYGGTYGGTDGGMVVWWYGGMVVWWYGGMVVWWYGGMYDVVA